MRFPAKSDAMPKWMIWAWIGFGVCYFILGIHASMTKKSYYVAMDFSQGVMFLLLPLFNRVISVFIYSEMDADCLRLHKFWKKKEIAWYEVRSVHRFGFTDSLTISFGHQIDDYGRIIVTPENREQFISILRQYAPQAEINI